ncbi:MAG TPA: response regulator transcription factor [Nocardioides sp.]|uniref:response regulator transcription factor n=1 Tax=Nocardioides sp. TaxID=35761 RepID=UPI002F405C1E
MSATVQVLPYVDILIVDDHQVFAEVLAMRLKAETEVRRVFLADSLAVARTHVRALAGGLALLDYRVGDECGIDLLDDLAALDPRPTVVVVSASRDPDEIVAGLRAGVDAWLVKAEGFDALVEVAVDARDHIMSLPRRSLREVVQRLVAAGATTPRPASFLDTLSPRELDVLRLLVQGLPRDRIAERLFLSPHTVRTHVQHLHQRADVHSTVALVARARESGLQG